MRKIKGEFKTILIPVLIFLLVFFVYWNLTKTFYQQDEWWGMGLFQSLGRSFIFNGVDSLYEIFLGKGRFFSGLIYYFFFKFFPFQVFPIAIFGIIFQAVNATLVFFLARKILKKEIPSFLAAVFFTVSSLSQGAVTWPASIAVTLPSTTLIILAILCFFNFLEKQRIKWIFLTFIFLYLSLGFKETGIYLFLYLPLVSFMFRKVDFKKFGVTYWPFFLFFIVSTFYRIIGFKVIPNQQWLYLTGATEAYWQTLFVRIIFYPLTSFSQIFIPPESFTGLARFFTNIYYPFFSAGQFALISQTAVLDLLSLIFSLGILGVIYLMAGFSKMIEKKYLLFLIGFVLFSFLPYAIISKSFSYFDSRHYYLATFAGGIILIWLMEKIAEKSRLRYAKIVLYCLLSFFLIIHFSFLKKDLISLVSLSEERKSFLAQLSSHVPVLSGDKNIFYINSDQDYYVTGNKIPFQQGTGYTLMVWYFPKGKIPNSLLKKLFLYDIGSQGYREAGGRGFGYFYDPLELKEAIKKYNLPHESIFSFTYDSKEKVLKASEIR